MFIIGYVLYIIVFAIGFFEIYWSLMYFSKLTGFNTLWGNLSNKTRKNIFQLLFLFMMVAVISLRFIMFGNFWG